MNLSKLAIVTGSGILLPLFTITVPWYPGRLIAGFLLAAFLPGYALTSALWPGPGPSPLGSLGKWLVSVAASYSLTILLLLLLLFASIPLTSFSVAGALGLTILAFSTIAWKGQHLNPEGSGGGTTSRPTSGHIRSDLAWLVGILVLAAVFRMAGVHYSDHHGDEADILLRAVSLTYGHTEAMFTHSKGPGEILVLNAAGALTGQFDEQTARLPFSMAGAIGIGLIVLLGQQLISAPAGRIAGLLMAVEGVYVSYARTAQYQSVNLLLIMAAIWCFYRFHQTNGSSRRLHLLATFMLAVAFLVHFETVLLLPVVGYLTLAHLPWPGWRGLAVYPARLKFLWPSLAIFLAIVTLFYLPFMLHPNLSRTGSYLENRIGAGDFPPFNNFDHFFYIEALKYNSAYYAALFALFLAIAAIFALAQAVKQSFLRSLLYTIAVSLAGLGFYLAGLEKLSAGLMALGLALFFTLVILSPRTPLAQRTLWLWLAPPFWIYLFLVNRPGKHHYLFWGALAILIGMAVMETWRRTVGQWPALQRPAGRWFVGLAGLALFLVIAWHNVMLLLRTDLEYMLTYPAHRSSFYPTPAAYPFGTRIGFGYPYRIGWQVIGQLRRTGQLGGEWAGNDAGNGPTWYMLGQEPTPCYPRYVLHGEITFKDTENFDVPFNPADFGYVTRYRIWGNDQLRMTVLEFDPLAGPTDPVDLYESYRFDPPVTAKDFAATLSKPHHNAPPQVVIEPPLVLGEGSEIKNNAPAAYLERAQQLAGRAALAGYDLDDRFAKPGGIVPLTLYWQAQVPLSLRYKVFVHLNSPAGEQLAQADDFPACGTSHANSWPPGQIVPDRHLIKLPPDIPPGTYSLVVGMYEPDLNLRLNYFDVAGNEQGNSLTIGNLTVTSK